MSNLSLIFRAALLVILSAAAIDGRAQTANGSESALTNEAATLEQTVNQPVAVFMISGLPTN